MGHIGKATRSESRSVFSSPNQNSGTGCAGLLKRQVQRRSKKLEKRPGSLASSQHVSVCLRGDIPARVLKNGGTLRVTTLQFEVEPILPGESEGENTLSKTYRAQILNRKKEASCQKRVNGCERIKVNLMKTNVYKQRGGQAQIWFVIQERVSRGGNVAGTMAPVRKG